MQVGRHHSRTSNMSVLQMLLASARWATRPKTCATLFYLFASTVPESAWPRAVQQESDSRRLPEQLVRKRSLMRHKIGSHSMKCKCSCLLLVAADLQLAGNSR